MSLTQRYESLAVVQGLITAASPAALCARSCFFFFQSSFLPRLAKVVLFKFGKSNSLFLNWKVGRTSRFLSSPKYGASRSHIQGPDLAFSTCNLLRSAKLNHILHSICRNCCCVEICLAVLHQRLFIWRRNSWSLARIVRCLCSENSGPCPDEVAWFVASPETR